MQSDLYVVFWMCNLARQVQGIVVNYLNLDHLDPDSVIQEVTKVQGICRYYGSQI
jgi:hypothetical protein